MNGMMGKKRSMVGKPKFTGKKDFIHPWQMKESYQLSIKIWTSAILNENTYRIFNFEHGCL